MYCIIAMTPQQVTKKCRAKALHYTQCGGCKQVVRERESVTALHHRHQSIHQPHTHTIDGPPSLLMIGHRQGGRSACRSDAFSAAPPSILLVIPSILFFIHPRCFRQFYRMPVIIFFCDTFPWYVRDFPGARLTARTLSTGQHQARATLLVSLSSPLACGCVDLGDGVGVVVFGWELD